VAVQLTGMSNVTAMGPIRKHCPSEGEMVHCVVFGGGALLFLMSNVITNYLKCLLAFAARGFHYHGITERCCVSSTI